MSAEKLRELKTLASVCPELNMANYTEDDVRHLNDWAVEISLLVEQYALSQQPAQATQAELTDEQILAAGREWSKEQGWWDFEVNDFLGCTRAILALHTERVPITEDQVWHNDALMSANGTAGFKMDALMRIVRAVEAHHGIPTKAKGEQ